MSGCSAITDSTLLYPARQNFLLGSFFSAVTSMNRPVSGSWAQYNSACTRTVAVMPRPSRAVASCAGHGEGGLFQIGRLNSTGRCAMRRRGQRFGLALAFEAG